MEDRYQTGSVLAAPAVIEAGQRISTGEMGQRALAMLDGLAQMALPSGARVVVLLPNTANAIALLIAFRQTDLVFVPLHPAAPKHLVEGVLASTQAAALITDAETGAGLAGHGVKVVSPAELIARGQIHSAGLLWDMAARAPDSPALILHTSGTTDKPKADVLSQSSLDTAGDLVMRDLMAATEQDVVLQAAPVNNPVWITQALGARATGTTLAVLPSLTPGGLLAVMTDAGVTHAMGVPTMAHILLKLTAEQDAPFPKFKQMVLGGATVERDLGDRVAHRFGCRVSIIYAISECLPVSFLHDFAGHRTGSLGDPVQGLEIKVVSPAGTPCPDGEIGEFWMRGASVMMGYWQADTGRADPQSLTPGGWFRSGDLGYRAADGRLVMVDRLKEIILTGGNTIYPSGVEATLRKHDTVSDVALVGRPHQTLGEVPVAYVQPRPGRDIDAKGLILWSKEHLPSWSCPRAIRVLEEMPKTPTGKVSKLALRQREAGEP